MRQNLISISALILAIGFSAFSLNNSEQIKQNALLKIETFVSKKANFSTLSVFQYNWGPQDDPNSYTKVPYFVYISSYCPGTGQLCAILAEEDLLNNPGHPTQDCLNYLLDNYGFYYYFPFEVPGLIEFKRGVN